MNSDAPPPAPPKRRGCFRTLFRTVLITVLLLVAVGFLARRQIGDALARNLDERLEAAGIYITWDSADWMPGPGIRLHDVEVFRDAAKTDRLALLSNVSAIKSEPGWDRWDTFKVEARKGSFVLDHGKNETTLTDLHLDLVIQPGKASLEQFRAELLGWHIEAHGDYLPPSASEPAEATPEVTPKKEESLLGDIQLDWLASVKQWAKIEPAKEAPVLKLEFHSVPESGAVTLALDLQGKAFRWREQNWDSIAASVKFTFGREPAPIAIKRIEIGHDGRTARLAATADLENDVLHVSEFESTLDPLTLVRAFAHDAAASLSSLKTTGQWHITGSGDIRTDQPKSSQWKGAITLEGDLTYAQEKTNVTLQNPALNLAFAKGVVTISDFKAGLWDGKLDLPESTIHLGDGTAAPTFQTRLILSHASLQSISHSFGSGENQPGVVQLDWTGGGGFDLPAITGSGSLSIQQAEFFRIPLLGPLHLVFDQLTPGFGKDVATGLTANHSLANGVLSIRNLKLDSKLTRIEADGDLNLEQNHAHLTARAKFQGIVGLTTALLSALLEVEGEGPLNDVKWKLNNLPGGALVNGAADVVGKAGGVMLNGGGTAVKATTDAAAGTVKEAGKAVKGILNLPGRLLPGNKK